MSSITSLSHGTPQSIPYSGPVEISQEIDDDGLTVYMYTEDLSVRSVRKEDLPYYQVLFASPEVRKTFSTDETSFCCTMSEQVTEKFNTWLERWSTCDAFSAFSYFRKADDRFVGFRVLTHGKHLGYCSDENAGYSKTASAEMKWGNGYAEQAAYAVVREFAGSLAENKCPVTTLCTDGETRALPLKWVTATAFAENNFGNFLRDEPSSFRVCSALGMMLKSETEKISVMQGKFAFQGEFALDVSALNINHPY